MSVIYAPAGRAREYAALACNIYRGCDHRCTYCYAPSATRRKRENFAVPETRSGFIRQLERDAERVEPGEIILLCFTCDAYQHLDVELAMTRDTIKILHRAGHAIHVLTKGGSRALRDLDLFTDQEMAIARALPKLIPFLTISFCTTWLPAITHLQECDMVETVPCAGFRLRDQVPRNRMSSGSSFRSSGRIATPWRSRRCPHSSTALIKPSAAFPSRIPRTIVCVISSHA